MGKSLLLWSNLMSAQDLRVLILSQESTLVKHPHAFIHDPDAAQCMKVSTVLCIYLVYIWLKICPDPLTPFLHYLL